MTAAILASLAFAFGPPDAVRVSYYAAAFHGHTTANGETFDMFDHTCASPSLPFGAVLLIARGERHVVVRVNDRGPFAVDAHGRAVFPLRPHPSRALDLSYAAACSLDMIESGVADVIVWRVR